MWRSGETSACSCETPQPAVVLHGKCGHPITGEEHRAYMREMNRQRMELALAFKVTPEEKTFLSNAGLVPGVREY
jgi:hypothetical protein